MKYNNLLETRLLTSEFTFGFELEGIVSYGSRLYNRCYTSRDYDEDDEYYEEEDEDKYKEFYINLCYEIDNIIENNFDKNDMKKISGKSSVHHDGSLDSEDENDITFEYSSKIYPCTPKTIMSIIKGLNKLTSMGIYVNDTCGMHHHIKFEQLDERNMVWIYCNMACDSFFEEDFRTFNNIDLEDETYANYNDFIKLRESIKDRDYENVLKLLTTKKYRVFRIHPQGTLEWRGPRGFLNEGETTISEFYKIFFQLIERIRSYVDRNELADIGISKNDFFKELKNASDNTSDTSLEFINNTDGYDRLRNGINIPTKNKKAELTFKKLDDFLNIFEKKPYVLFYMIQNNKIIISKIFKTLFKYVNDSWQVEMKIQKLFSIIDKFIENIDRGEIKQYSNSMEFIREIMDLINEHSKNAIQYILTYSKKLHQYLPNDEIKKLFLTTTTHSIVPEILDIISSRNIKITLRDVETMINNCYIEKGFGSFDKLEQIITNELFNDVIQRKIIEYTFKRAFVKSVYIRHNYHLYNEILRLCDNEKWNNMIIQFAEHNKEFVRYLTPNVNMKNVIRLIARYGNNKESIIGILPEFIKNIINTYDFI